MGWLKEDIMGDNMDDVKPRIKKIVDWILGGYMELRHGVIMGTPQFSNACRICHVNLISGDGYTKHRDYCTVEDARVIQEWIESFDEVEKDGN